MKNIDTTKHYKNEGTKMPSVEFVRPSEAAARNGKFVTSEDQLQRTVAGVLQIIEATGLPEEQLRAVKDLVKRRIYTIEKIFIMNDFFEKHFLGQMSSVMQADSARILSAEELGFV